MVNPAESHAPYREQLRAAPFWISDVPRDYICCLEDRTGVLTAVEDSARRLGITAVRPFGCVPSTGTPTTRSSLVIPCSPTAVAPRSGG